jgi:hypothetical protein
VFGKDSFLTLGRETEESRRAWADDADEQVLQPLRCWIRLRPPPPAACVRNVLIRQHSCGSQDTPDVDELKTPAKGGREKDAILGVRLGAGGRSYMVQDKKIGVLRNVHGGVQVGGRQHTPYVQLARCEQDAGLKRTSAVCSSQTP